MDPFDLRDLRKRPARSAGPFLLVWAPLIGLSAIALGALLVGLAGGAWLAVTLLVAAPSSLAGFFLTRLEPPRSVGHTLGTALMLGAAALTVLLVALV